MTPLASLDDLTQRLGVDVNVDFDRADAALADASALVRAEAGQTWVDDAGVLTADIPALIPSIVVQVALRLYRNADGVRSESVAGYAVSYQIDGTGLALTAEERRLVRRALGLSGVASVELEGAFTVPAGYVPVVGGEPMPYPFELPT